jgi:hypothetical protein
VATPRRIRQRLTCHIRPPDRNEADIRASSRVRHDDCDPA